MEFSYRINQGQFLRAKRSAFKRAYWSWLQRQLFLWLTILISAVVLTLLILGVFFDYGPAVPQPSLQRGIIASLWEDVIPFAMFFAVLGSSIYLQVRDLWLRDRRIYRNDPLMHGEITANLTTEFISTNNTAGATSQTRWNAFDRWIEKRDIVLLVMRSEAYTILNIAALSEAQRAELRGILTTALPKK